MRDLTPEEYRQIISDLASQHANEQAVKDVTIAELRVRLQAALAASQGAEEATE